MKYLLTLLLTATATLAPAQKAWFRQNAISPDGQTIAFAYKGDIFTVPTAGGEAKRLTSHKAYDASPCWSPDGRHIAFSSDRYGNMDVFVIGRNGGTPKRLTTHTANEQVLAFLDNSHVLYSAYYMNTVSDIVAPGDFTQVYSVDLDAHRPVLFSGIAMDAVSVNAQGQLLYQNKKGYEDNWRKHHRSPITRDLFLTQTAAKGRTFRQLTTDNAENRNPVWARDGKTYYFLSERDGIINVYSATTDGGAPVQLTNFSKHPVRYLSASADGLLCFSWDGTLYTMRPGSKPQPVNITVTMDDTEEYNAPRTITDGASSISLSKDEKEVVFAANGDIYATLADHATTKRITRTVEQEDDPTLSPDGRTVVYASERNGTWNLYATALTRKNEKCFTYATEFKETELVAGKEPFMHPVYSPDGKKIAFLANRREIRIYDVGSKTVTTALPAKYNFSYTDGDVSFQWSPDSRWLLTSSIAEGGWNNKDVIVVSADGKQVVNLTRSGYTDRSPQWTLGGKAILWASDRQGYRSHGSWGAEYDAYIMYLDREAWTLANMSKDDRAFYEAMKENEKADTTKTKETKKTGKKGHKSDIENTKSDSVGNKTDTVEPLNLDFENCEDRVRRLTINSSNLGMMYLTPDGKKFFYTARYEGGYDLWLHNLEENSTKIVSKGFGGGQFLPDKKGENLYICNGRIKKYGLNDNKTTDIPFQAETDGRSNVRFTSIFDHCVNQIRERFCDVRFHGIDFPAYAAHYRQFLPHIDNERDLSELASELIGELNCSHMGLRYRPDAATAPTASLGAFFDPDYDGDGLRILEVVEGGPLDLNDGRITKGSIIESIDGQPVLKDQDYFPLLAGRAGKWVRLRVTGPKGKAPFDISVRPVTLAAQKALLYKRWVKRKQQFTDDYSKGRIGYVHVQDMDSKSFRTVYSDILGKYRNRQALVVDERHNGGGWLHGDLAVLLSGKQYFTFVSRGQELGADPYTRWNRPSCVLMNEDCYSNAHGFPNMYRALGIGKLVGTPVAGTMTAVWWEQIPGTHLNCGLPQIYCNDTEGRPLENQQLDPDIEIYNTPEQMLSGDDVQLRRAIDHLLGK